MATSGHICFALNKSSECVFAEGQQGDLGERLQQKLQEWQQRLQSAAKLRSLSCGGSEAVGAAAALPLSRSAAASHEHAAGSACSSTASGGATSARMASAASMGGCLRAAQASAVQAAIQAAANDGASASGGASASSCCTAIQGDLALPCKDDSWPALAQAGVEASGSTSCIEDAVTRSAGTSGGSSSSPRIPAAASAAAVAIGQTAEGHAVADAAVISGPAANRAASQAPRGSRIKQLGLQAARMPQQQVQRRVVSSLPTDVGAQEASADSADPGAWAMSAAPKTTTPAIQPSKLLKQKRTAVGSSKAGRARMRSSRGPSGEALAGASVMRRQSSLPTPADPAASGANKDADRDPTADALGPPAGLAPLMLALAAAARCPASEVATGVGFAAS